MSIRKMLSRLAAPLTSLLTPIARRKKPLETAEEVELIPALRDVLVAEPVNKHMLDHSFAKQFVLVKSIPVRRVFVLKDVFVHGHAIVFRNLKIFRPSLAWEHDLKKYSSGKVLSRQWLANKRTLPEGAKAALAYDVWSSDNYYHWMIESLPRLLLVRLYSPDCTIITPVPAPEFVRTTIELLGFTKVIELQKHKGEILHAKHLVFPELVYYYEDGSELPAGKADDELLTSKLPPGYFEHPDEELISIVRRLLLKQFPSDIKPSRLIYVSRSRQRTRRLLNEDEIAPLLSSLNIETVNFEGMSFHEQVILMLETTLLVGVHGANMVNAMFLPQSSTVVELMNESHVNDAYYLLCSTLEIPYYVVPCRMQIDSKASGVDSVLKNDANLIVDISLLSRVLEQICKPVHE